jgi:hypothetical protein
MKMVVKILVFSIFLVLGLKILFQINKWPSIFNFSLILGVLILLIISLLLIVKLRK